MDPEHRTWGVSLLRTQLSQELLHRARPGQACGDQGTLEARHRGDC